MIADDILYKPITATAAVIVLLELNELKFAKRLEYVLKVLFRDAEVDVADIEAVEGDRVGMGAGTFRVADLSILLGFGKLDNNRNT